MRIVNIFNCHLSEKAKKQLDFEIKKYSFFNYKGEVKKCGSSTEFFYNVNLIDKKRYFTAALLWFDL